MILWKSHDYYDYCVLVPRTAMTQQLRIIIQCYIE